MDGADNRTPGTRSWGLQPGALGGKLESSPCPEVTLGKDLEGASSVLCTVYRSHASAFSGPWGCLSQHRGNPKVCPLLEVQSKTSSASFPGTGHLLQNGVKSFLSGESPCLPRAWHLGGDYWKAVLINHISAVVREKKTTTTRAADRRNDLFLPSFPEGERL